MEFCDENLEDVIEGVQASEGFLAMSDVKKITAQLFKGLASMHAMGIAHRDLKPENVLLKSGEVRICDVGSAKVLDMSPMRMNTPYVVSRYYRAPELILASSHYDTSIDIWAVGCMLFEMLTKIAIFPGDSEGLQLVEMQMILGPPTEQDLQSFQEQHALDVHVMKLFSRLTKLDANEKLDILTMLKASPVYSHHKFYEEADLEAAADLIEKCLRWDSKKRITAAMAIDHRFC